MKKTLSVLLVICFIMTMTAAAVSSEPVMVKEQNMDMNKMDMNQVDINQIDMDIEIRR